jgi:Family of unknown function (DUF6232)
MQTYNDGGGAGWSGRPMRTFYRDQRISVTDRSLTIEGRSFAVGELADLTTVRRPASRLLSYATAVVTAPIAAVAVAMAIIDGISGWWWVMVSSAGVTATTAAAVLRVMQPPRSELWSQYRGEQVLLLSDRDEKRFGQICRALLRACESARAD